MDNETSEKIIHDGFVRFGKMVTKGSILIEAVIKAVYESTFTCDVDISSPNPDGSSTNTTVFNVPLKILTGSQASFIEIPTVGTDCLLCYRDNNIQRPQISQVNQCDKILIKIGDNVLQVDTTGFIFNSGGLGGMVKVNPVLNALNNIQNTLNTFMNTTFNTHTHISAAPGSPTAVPVPLNTASLTVTALSDIENTKIKQ